MQSFSGIEGWAVPQRQDINGDTTEGNHRLFGVPFNVHQSRGDTARITYETGERISNFRLLIPESFFARRLGLSASSSPFRSTAIEFQPTRP